MKKLFGKLRGDQVIWLIVLLLAIVSILAVYSASSSLAFAKGKSTFALLFKQMSFVIGGFLVVLGCYSINLRHYTRIAPIAMIVSIALMLYVVFAGTILNSASRWINIAGVSFQPSELAKISVVMYIAYALERFDLSTFKSYALKVMLPLGILCVLCIYGSVSATVIIVLTAFVMLVCAGIKWRFIWYTIGIAIGMLGLIILLHYTTPIKFPRIDTMWGRIERFFGDDKEMTPEEIKEYKDKTYQSEQAIEAIQLGRFGGRGPGNSLKKDTLPHPYSDFIYAIIIEEFGLAGGLIVLFLYFWFFSRCITIARMCSRIFTSTMVLGFGFLIFLQAIIHIMVNVGLLPVTGQTLPLVSLGGTSLMIISSAFGIILAVNRTIEVKLEEQGKEKVKNG